MNVLKLTNYIKCSLVCWLDKQEHDDLFIFDLLFLRGYFFVCTNCEHFSLLTNQSIIPYRFISSMRSRASLMDPDALLSAPERFSPA